METSYFIRFFVPILSEHSRTKQLFFYLCEVKSVACLIHRLNKQTDLHEPRLLATLSNWKAMKDKCVTSVIISLPILLAKHWWRVVKIECTYPVRQCQCSTDVSFRTRFVALLNFKINVSVSPFISSVFIYPFMLSLFFQSVVIEREHWRHQTEFMLPGHLISRLYYIILYYKYICLFTRWFSTHLCLLYTIWILSITDRNVL
jgi:hypothetical protein